MENDTLIEVLAFPGWIVGVSYTPANGYSCWVINPELAVLNDGERYTTSRAAMAVGRDLIEQSLDSGPDHKTQIQE